MYVMPEAKLEYLPKWIFVHKLICNVELCYYNVGTLSYCYDRNRIEIKDV